MVKVPKVTGLEETAAKEALEAEDLEVKIEEEYNKKVEKGYVIGQDVEANTEVAAGTIVTIKVSQGVEETTVPNVLGKSKDDGTKELTDAGLTISAVLTEEDKTKNDGTILKQSLNPGDTVEKGSSMTITVNQIQQLVNGTAIINLKSIQNYTPQYTTKPSGNTVGNQAGDTTQVEVPPKSVQVKVVVGNDTVYTKAHKENETNIKVPFTGIGTIEVKLYVDDILKGTKQVNLSSTQTVTFE